MKLGEQIDKISKKYCKLTASQLRHVKKVHARTLRRIAKDINKPNPQYNRYSGFIG